MDELHLKYTKSVFYKTVSSDVASEIWIWKSMIYWHSTLRPVSSHCSTTTEFEQGSQLSRPSGGDSRGGWEAGLRLDISPTEKALRWPWRWNSSLRLTTKKINQIGKWTSNDVHFCMFALYMDETIKYTFCRKNGYVPEGGFEELLSSGYVSCLIRYEWSSGYTEEEKDFPARIARAFLKAFQASRET